MTTVLDQANETNPSGDDVLYLINNPGGTPGDRKLTMANLAASAPFTDTYIEAGSQSNPAVYNTLIGNGGIPNPLAQTLSGLTAAIQVVSPNVTFLGALSGFAYFTGTMGASCGSIQGGACESFAAMTGSITQAVLGWEGIGSAHSSGTYAEVTGEQGTAFVQDTCTVTSLTALKARAPFSNGGTPTVTNAYSFRAQEPLIGTNRYSAYIPGRTRLIRGTHANALEIANASNLVQWASDGTLIKGYASDGTSVRVTFDPTDSATERIKVASATGSPHQFSGWNGGSENFRVEVDGRLVWFNANMQTTVGAAGAAAALPGAPTKWVKFKTDAGTAMVIPAWLAA